MEKASISGVVQVWGPMADAAPLGLGGFALTTFMLSIHNAGWAPDLVWLTLAIFYGGATQFIAGMIEFSKDQVFGATVFSTYGAFWLALAIYNLLYLIPGAQFYPKDFDQEATLISVGWFITGFLAVNTIMLACSLLTNVAIFTVMFLLEMTEICLVIGFLKAQAPGQPGTWTMAGGYFGFFCAVAAFYASFAFTFNHIADRVVIPVGSPLVNLNKSLSKASEMEGVDYGAAQAPLTALEPVTAGP